MFWPSFPVARGNRWLADTLERVIQRKSDWNIQFLITSQKVNAFLIQHWNSFHVQGSKFKSAFWFSWIVHCNPMLLICISLQRSWDFSEWSQQFCSWKRTANTINTIVNVLTRHLLSLCKIWIISVELKIMLTE